MSALSILLVEDDPDIQENLRSFLESEGFSVASAFDGREALNYLKAGNVPEVILLDLMMPVMNGYEFLQAFCAVEPDRQKRPPIILLSAAADVQEVSRQLQVLFVKKPFDLDQLLDAIASARAR